MKSRWRIGSRVVAVGIVLSSCLHGCGLLMDAAELISPGLGLSDEIDLICRHKRLQVGISVEPFPPFVFPVVKTEQGWWVTGLDLELVDAIATALSAHCGAPIVAVPHVVHFRDLFRLLTEGQLDLFVSSVAYNVPHLTSAGLGYSAPYYDTGLSGIVRSPAVMQQIRAALPGSANGELALEERRKALDGLIVAAQEGRSAHLYAETNLKGVRLMLCDSLAAALKATDPPVDVILGKQAVLDYILRTERKLKPWQPLALEDGRPLLLNRELFTVVMAESSFHLQWIVNDVLFQLEESGRLAAMRHRWFDEPYVFAERATQGGFHAVVPRGLDPYAPGQCHWAAGP